PEPCALFQCHGCYAVLGDSLELCAQEPRLGVLVCYKVTNDVVCQDLLVCALEGALQGCSYYALSCRSCDLVVGFVLYSAPKRLACLRGLFCFVKDKIRCYVLKKQRIIEASEVDFPAVTIKE
ncbi:MS18B protein, partial [Todus mexicanus]|nr:MS18B protein [Todus mexicanus]